MAGEKRGTRDAYGDLLEEIGKNEKVVVLDADLAGSTRSAKFQRLYPERFFNMGIAEQDMMGTAAGLASEGFVVFASTFALFATGRPWGQIRQSICYNRLNVKIVASHGGITVGQDGATHQALEDEALMRVLPGMTVLVPADYNEAKSMIRYAYETEGPFYIRTSREKFPIIYGADYRYRHPGFSVVHEGDTVAILANGLLLHHAIEALPLIKERTGIVPCVVNVSSVKPLDTEALLALTQKAKAFVVAEEHSVIGGLCSAVSEIMGQHRPILLAFMGIENRFGISGKPEELFDFFKLNPEHFAEKIKHLLGKI